MGHPNGKGKPPMDTNGHGYALHIAVKVMPRSVAARGRGSYGVITYKDGNGQKETG